MKKFTLIIQFEVKEENLESHKFLEMQEAVKDGSAAEMLTCNIFENTIVKLEENDTKTEVAETT